MTAEPVEPRRTGRKGAPVAAPSPVWPADRVERRAVASLIPYARNAAQFRRTTGTSPHEFLLRRRIERAKALMRASDHPLVDIALAVGFGTQPHFTTVFKRLVGDTPHRWRQSVRTMSPGTYTDLDAYRL